MGWFSPQHRVYLLDCFRGLDAALDEHKAKGTQPGSPVYAKIHEQLAEDIAAIGFGKDNIPAVANAVGQLSTYLRLESLVPQQLGPDEQEAISHLQNQMETLAKIRANAEQAHAGSPQFIGWKSHTTDLMQHYISPNSQHLSRFRSLSFRSNIMLSDYPGVRHSGPRSPGVSIFFGLPILPIAAPEQRLFFIGVLRSQTKISNSE